MAAYAAFLVARKVVSSTLTRNIQAIRKVLCWRASLGQTHDNHTRLQAVLTWIDALSRQCQHATTPPLSPLQRTKLPHAKDVLKWQLQVERESDELLLHDLQTRGTVYRPKTARACQDTAFLSLAFGYLPPPRLLCIRYVSGMT